MRCAAERAEICASAEVSLLFTDDAGIADLNRTHRSKPEPTDVLSFPQDDIEILGDIAISLDTALRQAEAAGWPASSEVALLAVHGFLHLIGCSDDTEEDACEMEALTRAILSDAGLSPPPSGHPFFQSGESM